MWSTVIFPAFNIILTLFVTLTMCNSPACVPLEHADPHKVSPCIPLNLVNKAFEAAKDGSGLKPLPDGVDLERHHDHIDVLGNVLTETTAIVAKELHLDPHQIHEVLPRLDTSQTEIGKFCPVQFRHKICKDTRYRTVSGHCNNLDHPDWGATLTPFNNLLPPDHLDGVSIPRHAEDGADLPSARLVSAAMHRDSIKHDHSITTMLIAWGQIIDHDVTLTGDTKDPETLKEPNCCHEGPHHHNCFPIEIPSDDPFYSHRQRYCMNFLRSFAGVRSGCRLGHRVSFNTISSFLDANFAYGSTPEVARSLRVGKLGLLKHLDVFEELGLKPLLPLKIDEPDDGCIRPNPDLFCFLAGDNRVNEQLVLTVLHTIFLREHNRIAQNLYAINPHWDDELLYQETRRIIIAITQHITYNEFLPMVLGKEVMVQYGLELEETGYWKGYDPKVNPSALEEFITSAFRFGHSLLPHRIERWSHLHTPIDSRPLHTLLRQPYEVYRPGYVDTFVLGLTNQLAQAMDEGVTEEVTTLLFKEPKLDFGMDLAAMNIQRGRDHGVRGYTAYRKACGLSPIVYWDDLVSVMRNETVLKYRAIYRSPHDIDLWSGGVSEIPLPGSLVGPTFGCIIAKQFQALRYGDRFWYESPNWPASLTLEQLEEIRRVKLSHLLCQNSDDIKTIQMYAMTLPDSRLNPRVSCHSLIHSGIDFEKWKDINDPSKSVEPYPNYLHHLHQHKGKSHVTEDISDANQVEEDLTNLYRLPPPLEVVHHADPHYHTEEPASLHFVGQNNVANHSTAEHSTGYDRKVHYTPIEKTVVKLVKPHVALQPVRHVTRKPGGRTLPAPYPVHQPFPGLDGLFSPNPGYLVRQKFMLPRGVSLPIRHG